MKLKNLLLLIVTAFCYFLVNAQPQIELQSFASGFNLPLGIVNAGDERLFILEQRGLIRILQPDGSVMEEPFLDLSGVVSQSGSERGLLGLAFHPDYNENGYFFVDYTAEPDGHSVIARYSVDENNADKADPNSEMQLLTVDQPFSNHNGGQLQFGPDGYLYIGLGDGGSAGDPEGNAQNPDTLLGKILRIDVDVEDGQGYEIPADNPFVNDDSVLDEIWALGVRNPWRFSFDRLTHDLWIADVGQNNIEEINFQAAGDDGGENYGWRCYEGHDVYNSENCADSGSYVFPVFEYEHMPSDACTGSVTGGYVYRGAMFSGMFGNYIFADYCLGNFYRIQHSGEQFEGELLDAFSPTEFTTFGEDMFGELYVAMNQSGEIRKLVETGACEPVAMILEGDSAFKIEAGDSAAISAIYNPALEYQWNKNDEPIPGATQAIFNAKEEGLYSVTVTNPENSCSNTSEAVEVTLKPTLAVQNELENIRVYPNPFSDVLYIEGLPASGISTINVTDAKGTAVISEVKQKTGNYRLSTNNLPAGLYVLRIDHKLGTFQKKIILKKP